MHEAVLKDVLPDRAYAFGLRGQRHELTLHVCGEAGILFGRNIHGAQRSVGAHPHGIVAENIDVRAHPL